jgi:hypothetical protein
MQVVELLQTCNISKVQPVVKQKVLAFSYYLGIYKALWFGYSEILTVLCDNLLTVGEEIDPSFAPFVRDLLEAVRANKEKPLCEVSPKFGVAMQKERHETMLKAIKMHVQSQTHLFSEPGRH